MADEPASQTMELEPQADIVVDKKPEETVEAENGDSKRAREDDEEPEHEGEKRAKMSDEKLNEEERIDDLGEGEGEMEEKKEGKEVSDGASVGPKTFASSVEMFDYFYKLLHSWSPNINLNKYEHTMLLELLKKGHSEAERKIGKGIKAFQVRFHPQFKSRCFFLVREDESIDDFSFRKCVNHVLPLPENMQIKHEVNKALRGKGHGRWRGCGRGRGGK